MSANAPTLAECVDKMLTNYFTAKTADFAC